MDVRGQGGFVLSTGTQTQNALRTDVERLASGLRINTASDDPSGLAISETLASKVAGLTQGVQEVQDATNALAVAEGAMGEIAGILQRMRSLVVEARNGLASAGDLADMQHELDQLRLEIDRIAQNTNFNGRALLDGSASSAIAKPAQVLIETNSPLYGGGTLLDTTLDPNEPSVSPTAPQLAQLITVDSYDPTTGTLSLTVTIGSQDPSFGPEQTGQTVVQAGTDYPIFTFPPSPGAPSYVQQDQYGNQVLSFNIGTLNAQDVGASAFLVSIPAQFKASGSALEINTGDAEGSIISIDIPAMSTNNLAVNQVVLGDDMENQAAEYRIDYALQQLGGARAKIGGQLVALRAAATNANIAAVNTQASESAIRDLNVGDEMAAFTRDKIKSEFQARLLEGTEHLQKGIFVLVSAAIVAR